MNIAFPKTRMIFNESPQNKNIFGHFCMFGLVKGHFGLLGQKTARQAAKQPPTRKPMVSKVTSGYGGDMIPSSWVRLSPIKGGYVGVA